MISATVKDPTYNKAFKMGAIEANLPKFIGLHGFAGVGKDAVGTVLALDYGYVPIAFADVLREALLVLNPMITMVRGRSFTLQDAVAEIGWDAAKREYSEVRRLLQVFGTEVGRKLLGANVWIDVAFRRVTPAKRYVFTDVRFPNEFSALAIRDALFLKVRRPGFGPVNDHTSEEELPDHCFSGVINNDGALEDLYAKVRDALSLPGKV